jgi:hypothetical protein
MIGLRWFARALDMPDPAHYLRGWRRDCWISERT